MDNIDCISLAGIDSLRGFSYQIKTFILQLAKIKRNERVEYETIEDVNIQTITPLNMDNKCDGMINTKSSTETNCAIQVKRTKITDDTAEKILFNWLLLENRGDVVEYQLLTETSYGNVDNIFTRDMDALFNKIKTSRARKDSLIAQVKAIYGKDRGLFDIAIKKIEDNHKFLPISDLDKSIMDALSEIFIKDGVVESIYELRVNELFNYVIKGLFLCIDRREPYVCDYVEFRREAEAICERISNKKITLDYGNYTKANPIKLEDYAQTREYKQLQSCKLSDKNMATHLSYKQYYQQYRIMNLGNSKIDLLENIEAVSSENFEMVKDMLIQENHDTPLKRLDETKKRDNSYAESTHIRNGALIYLTKKEIDPDKQISWEDEEDA